MSDLAGLKIVISHSILSDEPQLKANLQEKLITAAYEDAMIL